MACNSWDKLCKAQRDYPKAKFADSFVQKSLKKSPKNPFLLAWRADLSLQLNHEPQNVIDQIRNAWQQPGSHDIQLLAYLYRLMVKAVRKNNIETSTISGVGDENSKVWLSAAKSIDRRERGELWSALGKAALREECWEDFRFAVVQYSKDLKDSTKSAAVKKHAHYTQILATQLAGEQQLFLPNGGMKSKIQYDLARRLMKQAYEASPDEPIACKDIRDLRFMGEVFARQKQCGELFELWSDPPASLKDLMVTHQDDIWSLRTRLPMDHRDWTQLEKQCLASIENAISQSAENPDSKCLWELCAWKKDVWTCLLQALRANRSTDSANHIVSDIIQRAFGTDFQTRDRAMRLIYMSLRKFIGTPMLDDCKKYWENHSTLVTCFADLRPFVESLESLGDIQDFVNFFNDTKVPGQDSFSSRDHQIHDQNSLKLNHILISLISYKPGSGPLEKFLESQLAAVCESSNLANPNSPEGFVGIYALLGLHHDAMRRDQSGHPFENTPNSRLLLQATMLSRYLVACDKEKQDRPRALLAARLHLNLGFGKCAFQMYSYTKCKEMLVHTLSPYVLSRISLTHPFGAKGYQGFSAEEELGKAIGTMERMERKTDETMYSDLQALPWDQSMNLLHLKQKFRSSQTKHICNIERRRTARLKGESVEHLPVLDHKDFMRMFDNVDRAVFPNYDATDLVGPVAYIMPNTIPDRAWIIQSYDVWENSSKVLYKESQTWEDVGGWVHDVAKVTNHIPSSPNFTPAERIAEDLWAAIDVVIESIAGQEKSLRSVSEVAKDFPAELQAMRLAMEKLRMPDPTTFQLDDVPTMLHENMLISCYTKLEVLRALSKMVDQLREKVVGPKSSHPLKSKLPKNWVSDIESETKACYEAIRDLANSYIKLIEQKGEAAIKAQVRWGNSGDILREVLSDSDVEFYASEYVDSALHAWRGVLQVKLK